MNKEQKENVASFMQKATSTGLSLASLEFVIPHLPDEVIRNLYTALQQNVEAFQYAAGSILINALPKDAYVRWHKKEKVWVCIIPASRKHQRITYFAQTKAQAIALCCEHYFKMEFKNAKKS